MMNLKKILLYIEPKPGIETISQFTVNLARPYDARVFALSIIKRPVPDIKNKTEEQAWKRLYEVEEDAFETGIKISLLLEEIEIKNRNTLTQKLINLAATFQVDLIVVASDAKLNLKKLTSETAVPVIVVPLRQNLQKDDKDYHE